MRPSADPSSFLCSFWALTRVTFLEDYVKLLNQSSNDWPTEYLPLPKHTSFDALPAFGGVRRPEDFQTALKGKVRRRTQPPLRRRSNARKGSTPRCALCPYYVEPRYDSLLECQTQQSEHSSGKQHQAGGLGDSRYRKCRG
jgi:hypothetical protein